MPEGITIDAGPLAADGLAATFAELARATVVGADIVHVLTFLSERTVSLLPVDACGVLVRDAGDALRVIGSSSAAAHLLDLFQVQNDEGPCLECLESGQPVRATLAEAEARWPRFAALLAAEGFGAVYAVPIASRHVVIGALNLFAVEEVGPGDLAVAQALADVAALALLQTDTDEDAAIVARRLYLAVEARNTVNRAIGVIAERLTLDPDAALVALRRAAAADGMSLVLLAAGVVAGDDRIAAVRRLQRPLT
jgi:GAF domain-containing protein